MQLKVFRFASIALVWLLISPADAEPVGRVIEQVGEAYFIHKGTVSSLRPGSELAAEDRVVTTPDGKLVIQFDDGSLCTIGPDSELLLADLAASEGGWLDLVHGIVRVILAPGARKAETGLHSRAVVASVRSTEFVLDTTLDKSAVFVASGTVQVTGRLTGLSVTLHAGEGTDVALRTPPTPAKRWGDKRVHEVMSRTTLP
jgi:hypothetical protein